MMKRSLVFLFLFSTIIVNAQVADSLRDKALLKDPATGSYYSKILEESRKFDAKQSPTETKKIFKVDLTGKTFPRDLATYKTVWHNEGCSQGNTGTCWDFSTTSYFESEVYRLSGKKIRLSQMYTAYWEYVEKARRFVQERGNSLFDEGSESNAVNRIYLEYGIVPREAYEGKLKDQPFYDHTKMAKEMKDYLQSVKSTNNWNEDLVLSTIKAILNHYMGEPPVNVTMNGKQITPKEYLKEIKLNPKDYIDISSLEEMGFWKKSEYKVPDNWWHFKNYYNVPVKDFMQILNKALLSGYSVAIGGDVTEAGIVADQNVAIVPDFDIPSAYINDNARQFRFSNNTTTDDHGMHLVGIYQKDGETWYLLKDSGSGSRNVGDASPLFGYYFFREDYVKLKMIDFMVHKDIVKDLLDKFKD